MNDIASVTKGDAFNHLVNVVPQTLGVYSNCVFFKNFKQVLFDIFKHKVKSTLPKKVKCK